LNIKTIVKSKRNQLIIGIVAFLLIPNVLSLNGYLAEQQQYKQLSDHIGMSGFLTVSVRDANGTLVSQAKYDTITTMAYDFAYCLMFGGGLTSGSGPGCASGLLFPSTTVTTTATYTSPQLYVACLCGIALSTSTQTSTACTGIQTSNGLAPAVASANSHTFGVNTPVVTLTNSWTNTGGAVTITSACLVTGMGPNTPPAFFPEEVIGVSSVMTTYAYENFSGQSVANGQSITIIWTFSM
jgi:hypothetical protein